MKPQTRAVLDWLRDGGSITDREADRLWGIRRLAARVREIREAFGKDAVRTTWETRGGVRFARYRWAATPEQPSLFDQDAA